MIPALLMTTFRSGCSATTWGTTLAMLTASARHSPRSVTTSAPRRLTTATSRRGHRNGPGDQHHRLNPAATFPGQARRSPAAEPSAPRPAAVGPRSSRGAIVSENVSTRMYVLMDPLFTSGSHVCSNDGHAFSHLRGPVGVRCSAPDASDAAAGCLPPSRPARATASASRTRWRHVHDSGGRSSSPGAGRHGS